MIWHKYENHDSHFLYGADSYAKNFQQKKEGYTTSKYSIIRTSQRMTSKIIYTQLEDEKRILLGHTNYFRKLK